MITNIRQRGKTNKSKRVKTQIITLKAQASKFKGNNNSQNKKRQKEKLINRYWSNLFILLFLSIREAAIRLTTY